MPKRQECVCCQEIPAVVAKCEEAQQAVTCMTLHPGFEAVTMHIHSSMMRCYKTQKISMYKCTVFFFIILVSFGELYHTQQYILTFHIYWYRTNSSQTDGSNLVVHGGREYKQYDPSVIHKKWTHRDFHIYYCMNY